MKDFEVRPEVVIKVTQQDVDDIMGTALDCGISYWCYRAEVVGEYRGEYASDQISRGGVLKLYDREDNSVHMLTLDGFLNGMKLWIESGACYEWGAVENNKLETGQIDAVAADSIVQYALFGEIVYG